MSDPQLTPRMRQVAELVADGLSYTQIGERLGLKPQTAEAHAQGVRTLLGLHTRAELAAWVIARRAQAAGDAAAERRAE